MTNTTGAELDKSKWEVFIQQLWGAIAFWQLYQRHINENLPGKYWDFVGSAIRDSLLMKLAHAVHLCCEIVNKYDVGAAAHNTLEKIKCLFEKGETADRSVLEFEDCGIKVYRDKLLAHPLNYVKILLGKETYTISLKRDTIEETLKKIKQFGDDVERHYSSKWDTEWYKGDTGIELGFDQMLLGLESAQKFDQLRLTISKKGTARVQWDHNSDEIIILEE